MSFFSDSPKDKQADKELIKEFPLLSLSAGDSAKVFAEFQEIKASLEKSAQNYYENIVGLAAKNPEMEVFSLRKILKWEIENQFRLKCLNILLHNEALRQAERRLDAEAALKEESSFYAVEG